MSGTLYLIGTPIGNLEDITLRQLRMLEEVDFICAEDTRVTLKLLNRYEIKKQLVSFHEHSSHADAMRIIERLQNGENCGMIICALPLPCIGVRKPKTEDLNGSGSGLPFSTKGSPHVQNRFERRAAARAPLGRTLHGNFPGTYFRPAAHRRTARSRTRRCP